MSLGRVTAATVSFPIPRLRLTHEVQRRGAGRWREGCAPPIRRGRGVRLMHVRSGSPSAPAMRARRPARPSSATHRLEVSRPPGNVCRRRVSLPLPSLRLGAIPQPAHAPGASRTACAHCRQGIVYRPTPTATGPAGVADAGADRSGPHRCRAQRPPPRRPRPTATQPEPPLANPSSRAAFRLTASPLSARR